MSQKLQRDVVLEKILDYARKDKDVYFLDADLGAKALDTFREELPDQFIHCGISEQNMMDLAAGMALEGKKIFTYAMGPFVTLRCFEHIKVALASMDLPITIIGNGVGYSYAPAGPTHYATEDVSVMRSLAGIEIFTASDSFSAEKMLDLCYSNPKLRYLRLDRQFLPDIHSDAAVIDKGMSELVKGDDICIVASGNMVHKALEVAKEWEAKGKKIGVVDLLRVKHIDGEIFTQTFNSYSTIISWEEHFLAGGTGSAICETVCDLGLNKKVVRIGIKEAYILENGSRDYLQGLTNIDANAVNSAINSVM